MRVINDPAIDDIAAQRRKEEALFELMMLAALRIVGTGPDSTPPARVTHPLGPYFNGSR